MKIGFVDADLMDNGTRHPNLALMKLAGYYRALGHEVELIYDSYDRVKAFEQVYLSKVFDFTKVPEWVLSLDTVTIGGTGFFEDGGPNLPDEIEHHMPYYDLYRDYTVKQIESGRQRSYYADYLDYSIGFATRGCFRKCSFCVNKKYDHVFRHSPVREFLDENRPYLYLWDDNFLALPQWEEVLDEIEATGKPFQFRQGLDLRLMTDQKAKRFTRTKYHGDFIFAFDLLSDQEIIKEKVQLWKRYTSKVCKMYVLCAYESQDERDIKNTFERIQILMKYGSLPYIMRYERYKTSPYKDMYIQLARWCNQPQFFKKKSFREFCVANQEYKTNQASNCSAFQAMSDFEKRFPDIAHQYFDLKFEELNLYNNQYGYGRRFANKPQCEWCKKRGYCWEQLLQDPEQMLALYFTRQIDLLCLTYQNAECSDRIHETIETLIHAIESTTRDHLIQLVQNVADREQVSKDNIPQYSDLTSSIYGVLEAISRAQHALTYQELGRELLYKDKKPGADMKYGENHAKLAAQLDLVVIRKQGSCLKVEISPLGKRLHELESERQDEILSKLCLRIPILQNAVMDANREGRFQKDAEILSATTRARRVGNIRDLICFMMD